MEVRYSPLEEQRFGVRTARQAVDSGNFAIADLLQQARSLRAELAIIRCDARQIDAVHALEAAGARLMDTVLTYERALPLSSDVALPEGFRLVAGGPEHAEEVARVARTAFDTYSGHYHADPRLPDADCAEVYASWASRSCTVPGVADVVILMVAGNDVAAFVTARRSDDVVYGDLDAVHPRYQGLGIHTALSKARARWASETGALTLRVPTHITQAAAQRSPIRLGLLPVAAHHTFHLWMDQANLEGQ